MCLRKGGVGVGFVIVTLRWGSLKVGDRGIVSKRNFGGLSGGIVLGLYSGSHNVCSMEVVGGWLGVVAEN